MKKMFIMTFLISIGTTSCIKASEQPLLTFGECNLHDVNKTAFSFSGKTVGCSKGIHEQKTWLIASVNDDDGKKKGNDLLTTVVLKRVIGVKGASVIKYARSKDGSGPKFLINHSTDEEYFLSDALYDWYFKSLKKPSEKSED